MKKYLMILIAMVCFGVSANADKSCKISGAEDGSSIQVSYSHVDVDGGYVYFSTSNDSEKISANFTFSFSISGIGTKKGSGMAKPLTSSEVKVSVPEIKGKNADSITVTVDSVESNKCK